MGSLAGVIGDVSIDVTLVVAVRGLDVGILDIPLVSGLVGGRVADVGLSSRG